MAKKGVLTKSDYLPYEEFLSTLEKLREDRLYWEELYFTIAFASALRVSDIRMLKWENVLNKNSIILIEKKTKKNREVRLNDETVSIIKELYTLMGKPSVNSYLFEGYKNKPMGIWQINKRLKDVKDRYNLSIDHFSTHSFRQISLRGKREKPRILDDAQRGIESLKCWYNIYLYWDKDRMRSINLLTDYN